MNVSAVERPGRAARIRTIVALTSAGLLVVVLAAPAIGRDRPYGTSRLFVKKWAPAVGERFGSVAGVTPAGGQFSKQKIGAFRCASSGDPTDAVDISCNTTKYGQSWAPDNELAIAVDPTDPDHLLAGSNDYFYRFNNSTGARQAIVPTGFFTSFDGGATWIDGQIPVRSGNGAGDPAPAFRAKGNVALMAQLENTAGQGGFWVSQGDVSVSRSTDGGVTWSPPITVMKGTGTGIGPANNAVFWDKEWITVNNYPGTPAYGRAVVTATKFINGPHGSYASSAIWMSYSDDGGKTWSRPAEISGKNPAVCTYQETGPSDGSCDEDQFSYPEYGPDGTLWVHFANGQHEAAWEVPYDFDTAIMVTKAAPATGAPAFAPPTLVADIEDGLSDMPYSVIGRQTIWGHQIRWTGIGTISVNPTDPLDAAIVYADRGAPNPNATPDCIFADTTGPDYDPCGAGPGLDTNVYLLHTSDGGLTWTKSLLDDAAGANQWFVWADHKPDGTLVAAWDEDTGPAPADTFQHVLWVDGGGKQTLGAPEHVDVSVTHWAGQYTRDWPAICGPAGYADPPVTDAAGKDCNVFHGDYTGVATGSDGSINVVWTGFNRMATSPQDDFYTGGAHDGYAQDAMFARR